MPDSKQSLRQLHPKRYDILLLIVLAILLLAAGLCLPVLTVRKIWEMNTFSIYSGIVSLYKEKHYALTFIIFFFSIIFPIAKLMALSGIWFVPMSDKQRKTLLYWLGFLGKWSMLDVFVIAVIIVSVKLGALASAKPERGIYFFGFSILFSMIAASLQTHLAKHRTPLR